MRELTYCTKALEMSRGRSMENINALHIQSLDDTVDTIISLAMNNCEGDYSLDTGEYLSPDDIEYIQKEINKRLGL